MILRRRPALFNKMLKNDKQPKPEVKPKPKSKPRPRQSKAIKRINVNKVIKLIKSMKPDDYPAYNTILKQYHLYGRISNILQLIELINQNLKEVIE